LYRSGQYNVPKWSKFRICRKTCTEVVCTEMVMYRSGPNPRCIGLSVNALRGHKMMSTIFCTGHLRTLYVLLRICIKLLSQCHIQTLGVVFIIILYCIISYCVAVVRQSCEHESCPINELANLSK